MARFDKVRRGLNPKEVDAWVAAITTQIAALEEEHRELRARQTAAGRLPLGEDHRSRFFALAEERAGAMVDEAKTEAHQVSTDSKREAERIITEARAEADRSTEEATAFLHHARVDRDRMMADLEEDCRTTLEEMRIQLLGLLPDVERVLTSSRDT